MRVITEVWLPVIARKPWYVPAARPPALKLMLRVCEAPGFRLNVVVSIAGLATPSIELTATVNVSGLPPTLVSVTACETLAEATFGSKAAVTNELVPELDDEGADWKFSEVGDAARSFWNEFRRFSKPLPAVCGAAMVLPG